MVNSILRANNNSLRMIQDLARTQEAATAAQMAMAKESVIKNTATDLWKQDLDNDLYVHNQSNEFQRKLWG